MSTRCSIYYSHEEGIHIYLEQTNGRVYFDFPEFNFSCTAKNLLTYLKVIEFIRITPHALSSVEDYVKQEES